MASLNLEINDIQDFFNNKLYNDVNNIVDLKEYNFIDPFFWTVLMSYNLRLKKSNKQLEVIVDSKSDAFGYFNYIKGEHLSFTTVPMREIQLGTEIEKFTNELINVSNLEFQDYEDKGAFKYLISELINNAIDHGRSSAVACAQRFPNLDEFEIIVSDNGIGFYESLKYSYRLNNVEEALKLSIKKEITGSKKYSYSNAYKNAGMGLYIISEVIKCINGRMFIISEDTIYAIHSDEIFKIYNPWKGSIVALRFGINDFQNKILDFGWHMYLYNLFSEYGKEDIF